MAALRAAVDEDFLREFRASFAAQFTGFVDDPATFDERSRSAFERARQFGLSRRKALYAYMQLDLIVGSEFILHPLVAPGLSRPKCLPPDERFDRVLKRLSPADWQGVADDLAPDGDSQDGSRP